jgi:hypothetical protein
VNGFTVYLPAAILRALLFKGLMPWPQNEEDTMSSLFHQPKTDFATVAGYMVSAVSLLVIIYILTAGWF